MNKNYKNDIESFLNFIDNNTTKPTTRARLVYEKYKTKINDIDSWPDIFGDLYDGVYVTSHGSGYFTIDGVHDCFPKTHYKGVKDLYQSHQPGIELSLRSVYEHFYHDGYDCFLEPDDEEENPNTDKIVLDFYNLAYRGADPGKVCQKAIDILDSIPTEALYDPEKWPKIFDKILGYIAIREEDQDAFPASFKILDYWLYDKKECGTYEELYRTRLGWEDDTLDFLDVWSKFYKFWIAQKEEIDIMT